MPASDEFFRNVKRVHVVFALSSVGLFVSTIWMMAADHTDEWRGYQSTFTKLEAGKLRAKEVSLMTEEFDTPEEWAAEIERLESEIAAVSADYDSADSNVPRLRSEFAEAERLVDLQTRKVKAERADRDVARANYDLGIRDGLPEEELDVLKAEFDGLQGNVDQYELKLEELEAESSRISTELARATKERDALAEELKKLRSSVDQANVALQKLEPDNWFVAAKRDIMEWPIIDGFNSHHKIVNDWLPDLSITLGMTETARFDRCRTCHKGIDVTETGGVPAYPFGETDSDNVYDWLNENKFPHPFATHPRPDVYVTGGSPHPAMEGELKFGCTICHDGNGSGTSFQNAEHGPNDPHQADEWEEKHHYHSNHFWEYPMQPKRFIESGCIKCHHSVVELGVNPRYGPTAPKVFHGYQLITKYGCFGCHEIHGYDAGEPIGPDLRLEPQTPEEAAKIAADDSLYPGRMRKVGPSLEHVGQKTTQGWIEFWTDKPNRFRPNTRMPQFFHLTNQEDEQAQQYMPVEVAAIAQYLVDKTQPLEVSSPASDYEPNAERGKELFATRGCLGCHSHRDFPGTTDADFGPKLSRVYSKIKRDENNDEFSSWLYTWIREPERHHPRTKMPDLFLDPYEQGGETIDPAADIVAFLLKPPEAEPEEEEKAEEANILGHAKDYETLPFLAKGNETPEQTQALAAHNGALNELFKLYLSKAIGRGPADEVLKTRKYPFPADQVKGDEIELAGADGTENDTAWVNRKLNYVGRRTISRYGCFGCHDIPGFQTARPIGTTLQDWGRKDTSRLAMEHIEEFLHHHGEPDGSSTAERVERALKKARGGGFEADEFSSPEAEEREMAAAYFYDSLLHHGRPGFIWQKLRQPRSYDYEKTSTKGYDERLRMPKFPFSEEDVEAIATFVLGLVAEPPASQYWYKPDGPEKDRIEGERLLEKYNCSGCHMLDMPRVTYATDLSDLIFHNPDDPATLPDSVDLLKQLKPARRVDTSRKNADGETLFSFRGTLSSHSGADGRPVFDVRNLAEHLKEEPQEQFVAFDSWETLEVDGKLLLPSSRISFTGDKFIERQPARGGSFAVWLTERLAQGVTNGDRGKAWQMVPPPLYEEGRKVQTPWLFHFLQNPPRLRQVTVLRMPKFNMDADEARSLANYFAAADGETYPYQPIPQRETPYLADVTQRYRDALNGSSFLDEGWKALTAPGTCINCHSVGGMEVKVADPEKDIRGPNLDFAVNRLLPDWTLLWLYNPKWITPYTSMPQAFKPGASPLPNVLGGDSQAQTIAVRDALMNYHTLMEQQLKVSAAPRTARTSQSNEEN